MNTLNAVDCNPLPSTGLDVHVGVVVGLALVCVVLGAVLLASRRRLAGAPTALLTILVLGAALSMTSAPPAQAASWDCVTPANSLTVVQTSTMDGLAPGIAPVPITGLVVNDGVERTHIRAVTVAITSVTAAPGTPTGTCDASDYVLLGTEMLVDRVLGPGGSTPFAGASIGFLNKATNQDACKGATIHLLYTANPG